ncbi:DeoR family transcriptional regulator [Clostridia bacterium]|nr:DeoR family transcriptional regulator [Clostridia bacterium]
MLSVQRRDAILDLLKLEHSATVKELSQRFFISETSIRRDLEKLERTGFIKKTYGGAILVDGGNDVLSLDARCQTEREAKSIIAQKAAELIQNGDVIFLDSSSTALNLVPYLQHFANLSIITNGVRIAGSLAEYPNLRIYCAGGLVAPNVFSCNGSLTIQMLSGMYADKAFISPKAIKPHLGVFCANEEEAAIRKLMITHSKETVLLCAAKKLSSNAAFLLCTLDEIQTIVCDQTLESDWRKCFADFNIRVM